MPEPFRFSRAQLIYGICLPLAVVLGYVLARPMDSPGLVVLTLMAAILGVPVLMHWYHPITLFSWNAVLYLGFLPGQFPLWMVCIGASFLIVVLNRCVDPQRRLMVEPSIAWSLVTLALVMVVTAYLNGGLGMRSLGSNSYGGKKYVFLWISIMGYFVLASQRVPTKRALFAVGLFFLPGLTSILGNLVYEVGGAFYSLYYIIPSGSAMYQALAETAPAGTVAVRIAGWVGTAQAIYMYFLARYGVRGIMDAGRPWRAFILLLALIAGMFGGFRSFLIFFALVFTVAFYLEGLHRTRHLIVAVLVSVLCLVVLIFSASSLPLSVQRALSFLPLDIDVTIKDAAEGSSNWRLDMWKYVLPEVGKHLIQGKGYAMDPTEMYMAEQNELHGTASVTETSIVAGDYHNGPLSVLIPFGIWGALALTWFLHATGRMLYQNYRRGDPALAQINAALLAAFIGKLIFFLTVFGSLNSDLLYFTGLAGLAVSLNGESRQYDAPQAIEDESLAAYT